MSKISILSAMLLALTLTPLVSSADNDKTTLKVYQNVIERLKAKYEAINQLTAEVNQKVAELQKEAKHIKTLIANYERVLGTGVQQKQLEIMTQAHLERLKEETHVAERARHAAQNDAKKVREILETLGTSGEDMMNLMNTISISNDGKVVNINGSYTMVITDRTCANQRWYAEIDTQHQGNLLLDIRANFSHCTTGCHWAFRHLEVLFNAYTSQVILNDTNNNGNGAGKWTLKRIATRGKHSEKMRIEKLAGTQKWCGPVDIKIESNQPIKLLATGEL